MEGRFRANLTYLDQLFKFHKQKGSFIKSLPQIDKHPVDLYRLKRAVESRGGYHKVIRFKMEENVLTLFQACEKRRWEEICRELGYSQAGKCFSNAVTSLKTIYQKYNLPYDIYLEKIKNSPKNQKDDDKKRLKTKASPNVLNKTSTPCKTEKNDLLDDLDNEINNNSIKREPCIDKNEEEIIDDNKMLYNVTNKEKLSEKRNTRHVQKGSSEIEIFLILQLNILNRNK